MRLIDGNALQIEMMDRGVDHIQTDDLVEINQIIDDAPTIDAVVIPGSVTNGDMINALFPNIETEFINQKLIYPNGLYKSELKEKPYNAKEDNLVFVLRSLADWWNSPYKAESNVNNTQCI